MSVVGPRPLLVQYLPLYNEHQARRHEVRPGFTGYAHVKKSDVLLTIFTPTYNRGYVLGKLYESLCKQTCFKFEWLIVDDGSEDDTYLKSRLLFSGIHDCYPPSK